MTWVTPSTEPSPAPLPRGRGAGSAGTRAWGTAGTRQDDGMSVEIRRSATRFTSRDTGRQTRHSFSFGDHYDPERTGFGAMVCHDDHHLRGGTGFDTHRHAGIEIVTWVVSGALRHRDSLGTDTVLRAGEAPHDGSGNATATYNYDPVNETVTLNGVGAHIGVPKATNNGELSNPADAPSSVTYKIVYIDANTALLGVEFASGAWWNAKIVKVSQKIDGTWKMAPEAGALKVGRSEEHTLNSSHR